MLTADIPFDLYSLAVPVLIGRWGLVAASVVGVGTVLPWALKQIGSPPSPRQRQVFSLAAVAFCLLAIPLLLDTYNIEAQHPDAVTALRCEPLGQELVCDIGVRRTLPPGAGEARKGVLYQLKHTGAFVAYRQTP